MLMSTVDGRGVVMAGDAPSIIVAARPHEPDALRQRRPGDAASSTPRQGP